MTIFRSRNLNWFFAGTVMISTIIFAVLLTVVAHSAYSTKRPIQPTGYINQTYLYGEEDDLGNQHRGIDWRHVTGTDVYAIASGVVVSVEESINDNMYPSGKPLGNFVMIRHNQHTQYDRTVGALAYVYSIYAHLKKNSVVPAVGQTVAAADKIALVNNTGNSTAPHLHLQINLSTDFGKTNPYDPPGWLQDKSRNPEAWVQAFNYGGTQTASVMGKVTDMNGAPISNLFIYGMEKPLAAEGAGDNDFVTARTYSYNWANPDDLYVENFATTDIEPGTYHLEAMNSQGFYRDLGNYTFVAGRTTYVGLYPVYLPDLRATDGWTSRIYIVNNSDTDRAHVVTNFYMSIGDFAGQREDYLAPHARVDFPSPYNGSADIIGSQDLSVVVVHERVSSSYVTDSYTGVAIPDTHVWVPLVHRNNNSWNSELYIQNTGIGNTNITVEFIPRPGSSCLPCSFTASAVAHERKYYYMDSLGFLSIPFVGSVHVSADQPLAVASTQFKGNVSAYSQLMETSNSQPLASITYAPLIQNNNSGWLSGVTLFRTGGGAFDLTYYNQSSNGTSCYSQNGQISNPYTAYAAIPTPTPSGPNPCSSSTPLGIFQAGSNMTGNVNQLQGATNATTYAAVAVPGTKIVVPKFRKDSNWSDGFVIANLGGSAANITVRLYDTTGWWSATVLSNWSLAPKRSVTVFSQAEIPAGFNGSALVMSSQPVAVSVNSFKPSSGGDAIGSYPAVHR